MVLAELGRAEAAAGLPDAVAHLEAAIGLATTPRQRAALLLELGRVLHDGGRLGDACAAFERGPDELGRTRGELAVDLEAGYLTSAMQDPGRAAEAHRRADAILAADPAANRAERGAGQQGDDHAPVGGCAARRDARDRAAALRRRRARREDGAGRGAWCTWSGASACATTTRRPRRRCELMFADARRRGSASMFAAASQLRARQRLWTGPIPDAVLDARAAVDMWRGGLQMYLHAAAYCLVSGLLEQDEPDAAEQALRARPRRPAAVGLLRRLAAHRGGRLAAHRGEDDAGAGSVPATGRRLSELLAINPAVLPWRSEAGAGGAAARAPRTGARAGRRGAGAGRALRRAARDRRGPARRRAARARRGGGRAAALGRRAARRVRRRIEQARALIDLGAAIRRAGRPVEARGTLREALALADAAGAGALARRAREELRLAGGRPRCRRPGGSGLTPSEGRVAELAAAGQTNRQIADALFVTVKSVEWHLGNVYRKLDIRGRGQLAAAPANPGVEPRGSPLVTPRQ